MPFAPTVLRAAIVVLISGAALTGCAYTEFGEKFDMNAVPTLEVGKTTTAEAIAKIGTPASFSTERDGTKLVQWGHFYENGLGDQGGSNLSILFDKDGKMIRVTHASKV